MVQMFNDYLNFDVRIWVYIVIMAYIVSFTKEWMFHNIHNSQMGLFTVGVPKKRKIELLWGYFLQITFIWNKFK
jgi:hypothetical protein